MAWHTPCDLCSHTPRVAEKYCRYLTRRATRTCRPSSVTLLASTRPYTQPVFNIPEASAHPVLCPTHRPSHRLKDHPKVANSHTDMAPRVSPEQAAIYTHFHVPSCSRLGPGSRCRLVSHTPSCKASPPRSHSGSNVCHPVVGGDAHCLRPPGSCHTQLHKHCSQLPVATHNCEVSHRRPRLPVAICCSQTPSSDTPRHPTSPSRCS